MILISSLFIFDKSQIPNLEAYFQDDIIILFNIVHYDFYFASITKQIAFPFCTSSRPRSVVMNRRTNNTFFSCSIYSFKRIQSEKQFLFPDSTILEVDKGHYEQHEQIARLNLMLGVYMFMLS